MPQHLPAELAHFKKTTMGSAILMGRVTFDGMNRRCLPGRETLILTRDKDFDCEGVTTVTSVQEALAWFEQQDKDLYIAGGAGVYKAFDGHYDALIKTNIEADLEGDTYFPQLDMTAFKVVSHERVAKDDKNAYDFSISRYEKEGDQVHATQCFWVIYCIIGSALCPLCHSCLSQETLWVSSFSLFKCFYQPCQYYSRLLWHPILEKSEE